MYRRRHWGVIFCVAVSALPLGCAQSPRPLTAELFSPPAFVEPTRAGSVVSLLDSGGVIRADAAAPAKPVLLTPLEPLAMASLQPLGALDAAAKIAPAEAAAQPASAVLSPSAELSSASSAAASPAPVPGTGTGVYQTVGGVMATVNGTPIYSGQVLSRLEKVFAVKARDMDDDRFRRFASDELERQLTELIEDELIFNERLNNLDEKDRELAEQITIHIKQEKITASGGSLEDAKRRVQADGDDFDEMMKRTYREIVYDLVERKKIDPMVQIGRDDIYEFYLKNVDKLYSQKSQALFRVIEVEPTDSTADADRVALEKITAIREKAATGAEFVALAAAENTDKFLRQHGGDPGGWMEPNSYRVEELEKAVWQLEPGGVTPVIKSRDAYYIGKLFDKKVGTVKPFKDPDVQTDIYNKLHQQQVSDRWLIANAQQRTDVDVVPTKDCLELAVDLAMQRFKSGANADNAGR